MNWVKYPWFFSKSTNQLLRAIWKLFFALETDGQERKLIMIFLLLVAHVGVTASKPTILFHLLISMVAKRDTFVYDILYSMRHRQRQQELALKRWSVQQLKMEGIGTGIEGSWDIKAELFAYGEVRVEPNTKMRRTFFQVHARLLWRSSWSPNFAYWLNSKVTRVRTVRENTLHCIKYYPFG